MVGIIKYPSASSLKDFKGLVVYTDGACSGNGKKNPRAGFGVHWSDGFKDCSKRLVGEQTNNRAELAAIIYALIQSRKYKGEICIATDSSYVLNSCTNWYKNWEVNGWKTSAGKPVKNPLMIQAIIYLAEKHPSNITWALVRGHDGVEGNEKADALAKKGANKSCRQHEHPPANTRVRISSCSI